MIGAEEMSSRDETKQEGRQAIFTIAAPNRVAVPSNKTL